jgi:hypothetical protein
LEMKVGGRVPTVSAYCLMLSICARRNRWAQAPSNFSCSCWHFMDCHPTRMLRTSRRSLKHNWAIVLLQGSMGTFL